MSVFSKQESQAIDGKFFIVGQSRHVVLTKISPLTRRDGSRVMAGKTPMFKMEFTDADTQEIGEEVSTALAAAINRLNDRIEVGITVLNITCVESNNPQYPNYEVEIVEGGVKPDAPPFE